MTKKHADIASEQLLTLNALVYKVLLGKVEFTTAQSAISTVHQVVMWQDERISELEHRVKVLESDNRHVRHANRYFSYEACMDDIREIKKESKNVLRYLPKHAHLERAYNDSLVQVASLLLCKLGTKLHDRRLEHPHE